MGLTGVAILTVGFNYGLIYGSAFQGALVYALGPAAVAVAAVLGPGGTLSPRRLAGIILSVAGGVPVGSSGENDPAAPPPRGGGGWRFAGGGALGHHPPIAH